MLLAQIKQGATVKSANLLYRGDAATKSRKLISSAFAAGLMESAMDEYVNIVNAELLAKERGINITESTSSEVGDFTTMIRASIETDKGEFTASGTIFGKQFLRLVRLGQFSLDAYLDGVTLLFSHQDAPGLIGFIGTIFGQHGVNIAQMTVGRQQPGGDAIAVLNLDSLPSEDALRQVRGHDGIKNVSVVKLPPAGLPQGNVRLG